MIMWNGKYSSNVKYFLLRIFLPSKVPFIFPLFSMMPQIFDPTFCNLENDIKLLENSFHSFERDFTRIYT
jgi:hypothetical protein